MGFEFFWDCWFPALFISIWQLIYLVVLGLIVFVIAKTVDKINIK